MTDTEKVVKLAEACRIFTRALGNKHGYIPNLGAPLTRKALSLMEEAGVEPLFYWDAVELEKGR